jgi:hypothetical protein
VVVVGAQLISLGTLDDPLDIAPCPGRVTRGLRPAVVVTGMTADVDHDIDRAAPAEHLASGPRDHLLFAASWGVVSSPQSCDPFSSIVTQPVGFMDGRVTFRGPVLDYAAPTHFR